MGKHNYYDEKIGTLESSKNFDITQYGVGFTKYGGAGPETEFLTYEEIIDELNNYLANSKNNISDEMYLLLRNELGTLYKSIHDYSKAEECFKETLKLAESNYNKEEIYMG